MKQLEQEKDILLQGLEAVDRARDWYQKQIQAVQDKQKYIGKGSSPNVRTQGFVHSERKQKPRRLIEDSVLDSGKFRRMNSFN